MDLWFWQLLVIGGIQGIVLIVVSLLVGDRRLDGLKYFNPRFAKRNQWVLFLGLVFMFGIAYDIFVGHMVGVFAYPMVAILDPVQYSVFLGLNSVISYGIFACTVAVLPIRLKSISTCYASRLKIIFGISIILSCVLSLILPPAFMVFVVGAVIVFSCEFIFLVFERMGPIAGLFRRDSRLFLTLWGYSISLGLCYEAANSVIRLWEWTFFPPNLRVLGDILVVLFGYFVLLAPALVISRLTLDSDPPACPAK